MSSATPTSATAVETWRHPGSEQAGNSPPDLARAAAKHAEIRDAMNCSVCCFTADVPVTFFRKQLARAH